MKHQESNLQISCVNWFRYQHPKFLIFSVPNGGIRTARNARTLKAEGALAGVADLIVCFPNGLHIYFELKSDIGRQSKTQQTFEQSIVRLGNAYHLVRTFTDFKNIVERYSKELRI